MRQIGTYIQMAGRGMRPFPGKSGFDIIDHSGCFYEHGRIDVDFEWMLTKGKKMRDLVKQQREKQVVERVCRECKYIFAGSLRCPNCGLIAEKRGIFKDYIDADLVRLTYGDVKNMRREKWTPEMKRKFYRELVTVATVRCEKRGKGDPLAIASAMFKSRFDAFPPWKWRDLDPLPVTPETKAWVTSNNIRFARRKDKERAAA